MTGHCPERKYIMEKYKNNRFHICRHAIAYLGDEHDYDIGVAALDFANRMGWAVGVDERGAVGEHNAEYEEFLAHVNELQANVRRGEYADNAVKRYFYE